MVVSGVLLLHAVGLWALQSGLLMRAVEMVVPVLVISDIIELPRPKDATPPPQKPVAKTAPTPVHQPVVQAAAPVPLAIADTTPSPQAPVGVTTPQPSLPPIAMPVAASPLPAPPPRVELPSSDAEYLHNPKPEYPRISKQRNEQGKVVVNVFIGPDGLAQKAEIKTSSGFERLDQAALATVKAWRFAPGKRGGVPEAMWFAVPLNFVLE
jgi:protein TonB